MEQTEASLRCHTEGPERNWALMDDKEPRLVHSEMILAYG